MKKIEFYSLVDRDRLIRVVKERHSPSYFYFMDILKHRVRSIRECLGSRFELNYAIKANPNRDILREVAKLDVGADVASIGELKSAIAAGIPVEKIEFSGPGKQLHELQFAIDSKIGAINLESFDELQNIITICKEKMTFANVAVRINPNVSALKSGLKMAGDTQFGFISSLVPKVLADIEANDKYLHFRGIHVHAGSQILDDSILAENYRVILEEALLVEKSSRLRIKKINFGGGWGINYFPNQTALNLEVLRDKLNSLLNESRYLDLLSRTQLIVEPGRFLVGECGVYAARVLSIKQSGSKKFAILDGGMHQNYLLAGGMGQVIRRNFELDAFIERASREEQAYTFAGPLCTPQDILADNVFLPGDLSVGDAIVFFNSGAYGYSASPLHFLSHSTPEEHIF